MYLRSLHADATIPVWRQLVKDNPLGILTTALVSDNYPLIQSSHIPFVLDVKDESSETELGVLRGHLARVNPQSKAMIEAVANQKNDSPLESPNVLQTDVQVLFHSFAHHYVTPKFYTTTKPSTGKVVPTWNYAAVQVYGRAKIYYDTHSDESGAFLARQIDDLSQHAEEHIMGYTGIGDNMSAWKVSDAPESFIRALQKAIIGIEIEVDRMEGKFKMSQELGLGDREGVIKGFKSLGSEVGDAVADIVKDRSDLKEVKAR